jgi:hypothetical protein
VTLTDTSTGLWLVETTSAAYVFDMDARTIVRRPKERSAWPIAELRKDEQVIPLIKLPWSAMVGWPLQMIIDVRGDGVVTVRNTTPVESIQTPGSWN